MGLQPGINFISNDNTSGETFRHISSALSPKALRKTQKSLTDIIMDDDLPLRVDNIETLKGMLFDIFDIESRNALFRQGYSAEQEEDVMKVVHPIFNKWFDKYFGKAEYTKDFKIHFFKEFKQEFIDNIKISLAHFLGIYPSAPFNLGILTPGYRNLFLTVLKNTATQLELYHNGPVMLESDENDEKKDSALNIYLN